MSGPVQFKQDQLFAAIEGKTTIEAEPAQAPTPPKAAKPIKPQNIVSLAKARLREVKTELRRMRALEKERDELERLIKAAENAPRATVTNLKRSAG